MKLVVHLIGLFVAISLLSGCWDSEEIEDLSLLVGVGIDLGEDDQLSLTHQILLPASGQSAETPAPSYENATVLARTVHDAIREVAMSKNVLFANQQRLIIINENVLKSLPLDAVINQFIKDNDTRRSCIIMVSKDPAEQILSTGEDGSVPSNDLYSLSENISATSKILPSITLGQTSASLQAAGSFAIQSVSIKEKMLKLDGAGVINNHSELAGMLTADEVSYMNWLEGNIEGGIIVGEHKGKRFSVEVIDQTNKEIKTTVNDSIEKAAEKEVERQVGIILDKLQNDLKSDAPGFFYYIRSQHPKFYKQNKNNMDEIFSKANVQFKVDLKIIDFGAKGATK
ncbi:Ger(x)C family spore germination protein [Cytobacillus gottheilii]|uniref:Ger(x)C family spore germination protein n=1 Tax=Cytobacillus gottheilii TaxID=859144 RepID=UPI002495A383|nr:Ger(x)C family spore germination protein [Cytobacillus gottheilii]